MTYTASMDALSTELRQRIVEALSQKGAPFDPDNIYGHTDGLVEMHFRRQQCAVVAADASDIELIERLDEEFGDTFNGNDDVVFLLGKGFSCRCGELSDLTLFLATSFGNIVWWLSRRGMEVGELETLSEKDIEARRDLVLDGSEDVRFGNLFGEG